MIEQLFGSNTRFRLLRFFFQNSGKSFYVRELTRALDTQINAIRRELALLLEIGIIRDSDGKKKQEDLKAKIGSPKRKYYTLDQLHPLFPELQALLLKDKVLGQNDFLKEIQEKAGDILLFVITGKFTGNTKAATDMLIVGDMKPKILLDLIAYYEKEFGTELRYTLMDEREFMDRRYVMDKFVFEIFEGKHVVLLNKIGIQ